MSVSRELRTVKKRFKKLLDLYQELYYYGCEVDLWLPELTLLPYITVNWHNDPTWYRVIAPPGSGKSTHLDLLADYEGTYAIDEFTPKSFVSGFRGTDGSDPSKLPDMDGKVVLISDESTFMEQRQEDRNAVQSMLRKLYDGGYSKSFGNMKEKQTYKVQFNILVASTPAVDRYFLYNQALGERYTNFRLQIPKRKQLVLRAYENQFRDMSMLKNKLKKRLHNFLRHMPEITINDIEISDKYKHLFIDCADFIATIRTHVTRNSTGRHVTTMPQAEVAGRLVKQMTQTAVADAIVRGDEVLSKEHATKAIYIGLCSITSVTGFILFHIWEMTREAGGWGEASYVTSKQLTLRTGLGGATINRILEDFAIHHVLDLRKGKKQGGRELLYRLSKESYNMMRKTRLFQLYRAPTEKVLDVRGKEYVNRKPKTVRATKKRK